MTIGSSELKTISEKTRIEITASVDVHIKKKMLKRPGCRLVRLRTGV